MKPTSHGETNNGSYFVFPSSRSVAALFPVASPAVPPTSRYCRSPTKPSLLRFGPHQSRHLASHQSLHLMIQVLSSVPWGLCMASAPTMTTTAHTITSDWTSHSSTPVCLQEESQRCKGKQKYGNVRLVEILGIQISEAWYHTVANR